MSDPFRTPANSHLNAPPLRSTAVKRDTLAAELEKDPQLSTAKRHQRSQVFTSTIAHASLERQLTSVKATKMELEAKLREKDALVEQLERDRRWFAENEKKEREEKEKERAEWDEERRKMETELRSLRSTLANLREERADTADALSNLTRTTNHTIATQNTQLTSLNRQNQLLTTQLSESQRLSEERARQISDLQIELEDLRSSRERAEKQIKDAETMSVVREELHRQAKHMRDLEKKNERLNAEILSLRERQTSVEVLREEKRTLERKLASLEEMRERAVRLEAEVEAARRERAEWAQNASQFSVSVSVTSALSELRLTHAKLLEEHGAILALLRQREAQVSSLEQHNQEAQERIEHVEGRVKVLEGKIERSERRALLAEREVGFLQALVASYNAEAAHDSQNQHPTSSPTTNPMDAHLQQRVHQLESVLNEYKTTNDELIRSLDSLGVDPKSGGRDIQRLREELIEVKQARDELQEELKSLQSSSKEYEEKIDQLEQQLFELSGEIAGGRHVPPGVRVLSMKDNPEEQWFSLRQEAMDKLKRENEALMARLRELSERTPALIQSQTASTTHPHTESLVPRESYELALQERDQLDAQLKQQDKRLQRLQQVFTSKSAEFREAIAAIMGVKLAFYSNGQVRVTSIYDLNASFVFQPSRSNDRGGGGSGTMQLVGQGESVSEDLEALMQTWIVKEQCIPAFVALVTLDCYEKAKASGMLG